MFEIRELQKYLSDSVPSFIRVNQVDLYRHCESVRFSVSARSYVYLLGKSAASASSLADLNAQLQKFVGNYDFRALSYEKSAAVRTLYEISVGKCADYLVLRVCGQAFCYHQVRCLAGLVTCCLKTGRSVSYLCNKLNVEFRMAQPNFLVLEGFRLNEADVAQRVCFEE